MGVFSEPSNDTVLANALFVSTEGQLDFVYFYLVSWNKLKAEGIFGII